MPTPRFSALEQNSSLSLHAEELSVVMRARPLPLDSRHTPVSPPRLVRGVAAAASASRPLALLDSGCICWFKISDRFLAAARRAPPNETTTRILYASKWLFLLAP